MLVTKGLQMPRPKSFDPDAVLAKAMGVFWEKGYDAASISDLTAAMGINRFSLYDTFGDKHQLYLKALEAYESRVVEPLVEKINQIDSLQALQAYFNAMIDYQHSCSHNPCCMMHKAAITQGAIDQATKQRVESSRARFHGAFHDALERMKRAGDLRQDLDVTDAAWMVMITQAGLVSYAATPMPAEQAKASMQLFLNQLKFKN